MDALKISSMRPRTNILDRPLSKGKSEVSLSIVALLFSEMVQYCQSRVYTVPELQNRLVFCRNFNLYILINAFLHNLVCMSLARMLAAELLIYTL